MQERRESRYGEGIVNPTRQAACVVHCLCPDRTRPRRAARTAAHGRRGRRRRDDPAPRSPIPTRTSAAARSRSCKSSAKQANANVIACDDELAAASGAQPRGSGRRLGRRPHRGHPRHLRRTTPRAPRASFRSSWPSSSTTFRACADSGPTSSVSAPEERHRHQGPGRVADRNRPSSCARPHHRAAQAARRGEDPRRETRRPSATRKSIGTVALAGYTNAGKSTLLNALTGAEVTVGDRLFHTLDPTTRTLEVDGRDGSAHRHGRLHSRSFRTRWSRRCKATLGGARSAELGASRGRRFDGGGRPQGDDPGRGRRARGNGRHREGLTPRAEQDRPCRRRAQARSWSTASPTLRSCRQ